MTDTPHSEPAAPPSALPWPPILLVALIVAAVALGYLLPLPWPGEDDLMARVAGDWSWGSPASRSSPGPSWTLAPPWHHHPPDKAADVLVTDGPFRFRRNPIYIGHVFVLLGIAELTHNVWFALLAVLYIPLVTWLAVLPEERHLEARFGDAWRAYRRLARGAGSDERVVAVSIDYGERERQFLETLKEDSGRDARRVDGGHHGRGPDPPQRHHRLAAPPGLHVLEGLLARAHPQQRRQAGLLRRRQDAPGEAPRIRVQNPAQRPAAPPQLRVAASNQLPPPLPAPPPRASAGPHRPSPRASAADGDPADIDALIARAKAYRLLAAYVIAETRASRCRASRAAARRATWSSGRAPQTSRY